MKQRSEGCDDNLPVVEEDIWNPHQVRGEAQVLDTRVVVWVP